MVLEAFCAEVYKKMLKGLHLFFREFRKNFLSTGAFTPSSPALSRAILKHIAHRASKPVRILEVGPGTGAFTFHILRHLRPGDSLHIYELNLRFFQYLQRRLHKDAAKWPGVEILMHHSDIRHLSFPIRYDYIISGLPFANFDEATICEIMELYFAHLAPQGVISYFEYILPHRLRLRWLKPEQRTFFRRKLRQMKGYLQRYQVGSAHVWLNLPPAHVHHLGNRGTRSVAR